MPDENVSIKSSGKDILVSGSVQTFGLDNLELTLSDLKFTIQFLDDTDKQRIESSQVLNKEMRIRLFNFSNPLGTGMTSPQKIGIYKNRELYFNFIVYALNKDSIKLFHYTFYLGDNIPQNAG